MKTAAGILMIEPSMSFSAEPIVDELTKKMTAAWRLRRDMEGNYRGTHRCNCGVKSDSKDHWIGEGQGMLTNSLCIHYLAFHRAEVPQEELQKVSLLPYGEEEPSTEELSWPKGERMKDMVDGETVKIVEPGEISDGYHTFNELYAHRNLLFIAFQNAIFWQRNQAWCWRARLHADGSMFEGWFIAGIDLPTGTITYHLPLELWDMIDPGIQVLPQAPPWDGHTPKDVLDRLVNWMGGPKT